MDKTSSAKPAALSALAVRGAQLESEIKERNNELKKIREALIAAGAGIYVGENGASAHVIFPSPSLKPDAEAVADAQIIAGRKFFPKLFNRVVTHKPNKGFRELARAILTPAKAEKLIKRCEVESHPQVQFTQPAAPGDTAPSNSSSRSKRSARAA